MSRTGPTRSLEPEQYAAIFEYSLDGVLLTVPDGRVLAANRAACQILGRSEEQICAIGRQGLADPTDPRWATGLAERARTGRTRIQARMLRSDGTSFEIDLSSAVFTTADGEHRNVVIFRDLTEHLALARAVALANERDRIAGDMHRTVISRASAISILAYGLLALVESDAAAQTRVRDLVRLVDQMIVELRQAIFSLGLPEDPTEPADAPEHGPGGAL